MMRANGDFFNFMILAMVAAMALMACTAHRTTYAQRTGYGNPGDPASQVR